MPGAIRAHGVWVEGYYDYEKHENLNPGQPANPTRRMVSGGLLSGADVSHFTTGPSVRGFQLGVFSGYNSTRSKFTDTVGLKLQSDGTLERSLTTDARQEVDGAMVGVYGSVVHGAVSADLAVKVDMFSMEQRFNERRLDCADTFFTQQSTAMTNFIVASNANYRFELSPSHYLEPTVGLRWTHTDFGGNAPALGVRDGEALRVQGGLRLGTRFTTPDGWIWQTSVTGLLYSDVSLSGFVAPSGTPLLPNTPLVDEGKLRAMGILDARVDVGYGYTIYGDVEVRGGDDVIGFGSRLGIRYQW